MFFLVMKLISLEIATEPKVLSLGSSLSSLIERRFILERNNFCMNAGELLLHWFDLV